MRLLLIIKIFILWLSIPAFTQLLLVNNEVEYKALTNDFLQKFKNGELEQLYRNFDETMSQKLPLAQFKSIHSNLTLQIGHFVKTNKMDYSKKEKFHVINANCEFEKMQLNVHLVFDSLKRISGFFMSPADSKPLLYKIPDYVDTSSFYEVKTKVGNGTEWELPAILSIPKRNSKVPLIILVHGSGPNDSNETVGGTRVFKDIAFGLASRGIAVLRYQKRTKEYGQKIVDKINALTMNEETVDDAIAAIKTVSEFESINQNRIFILGHSQGGFMMPRIISRSEKVFGYVIMAGLTRNLEDTYIDQIKYIISLDSNQSNDSLNRAQITQIEKQVAIIKSGDYSSDIPVSDMLMGLSANYWKDLRNYNPCLDIKKYQKPILVLQGQRDYQVTTDDFNNWKMALEGNKQNKFILYADLNHIFVTGTGKAKPAEYLKEGHVDKKFIIDLSEWINSW
ncbi:MAG: prolyl oligopeptidase family serine peptidase [Candidatus Kapabacteria bacterium]|nr:prolyl oligopeptidase family serine peptidase [Candidatus Kapabacteria bacterium]